MRQLTRAPQSVLDLREVIAYLDQRSEAAAVAVADAVDRKCEQLRTVPFQGRARDDLSPGLRSVVVGDYLLFYRVSDAVVEFVRFIHGSRDLPAAFAGEDI
jgi:toxin ParE1/3/4